MEVSDSLLKNVGGRPRRTDWQEPYLDRIRLYGTKFISAREVGVPWSVVWEECERNTEFAESLRMAQQEFADRCEEVLLGQGIGMKGNPLPMFALLKKHRPQEYIERHAILNVDVHIDVPTDQARQVLGEMLAHVTPSTVERLSAEQPHRDAAPARPTVLDVVPQNLGMAVRPLAAPQGIPVTQGPQGDHHPATTAASPELPLNPEFSRIQPPALAPKEDGVAASGPLALPAADPTPEPDPQPRKPLNKGRQA